VVNDLVEVSLTCYAAAFCQLRQLILLLGV
jgi:hypothetical protein